MGETVEDLVKKHGYTPEQAEKIIEIFSQNEGDRPKLNKRCFTMAQQYWESACALESHMQAIGNANVAPGIVLCKSISLELFFKTLIIIDRDDVNDISQFSKEERKKYMEHEVPKLYDLIPESYKNKLITIYSARMGIPKLTPEKFRESLVEKANDIFVKWRYIFEKSDGAIEHLDLNLVNNLINSAELAIVEIKQNI